MRYPTKDFFFMIARYPNATPPDLIGNQKITHKKIYNPVNGSSATCKMRYAQLANIAGSTSVLNNMIFTVKQIPQGKSSNACPI